MSLIKDKDFLSQRIHEMRSFLCVGLDPDVDKIPQRYKNSKNTILNFCQDVVAQTKHAAIAYKINIAFFESQGPSGWEQLENLVKSIPEECFIIADAKRADIGNTSAQYAQYYFEKLNVDALTLHPYMGIDSLIPFLKYKNKWSIVLALTSNEGSSDFEKLKLENNKFLFETVLEKFESSPYAEQLMYVVGATQVEYMKKIRQAVPERFLLIPGVGEQGGDLESTISQLRTKDGGMLINVSRKILYPNGLESSLEDIRSAVEHYSSEMRKFF